jgi:hypothetical protein
MSQQQKPDPNKNDELDLEFGEQTLLEIDEAGRAFRKVLMDDEGKEGIDKDSKVIKETKKKS